MVPRCAVRHVAASCLVRSARLVRPTSSPCSHPPPASALPPASCGPAASSASWPPVHAARRHPRDSAPRRLRGSAKPSSSTRGRIRPSLVRALCCFVGPAVRRIRRLALRHRLARLDPSAATDGSAPSTRLGASAAPRLGEIVLLDVPFVPCGPLPFLASCPRGAAFCLLGPVGGACFVAARVPETTRGGLLLPRPRRGALHVRASVHLEAAGPTPSSSRSNLLCPSSGTCGPSVPSHRHVDPPSICWPSEAPTLSPASPSESEHPREAANREQPMAAACSFRSVGRAPLLQRGPAATRVRCCSAAPSGAASTSKLVSEVKERLEREHPGLPTGRNGRDDEEMILWFLKDRKFSVDETITKLTKAIKWRQDFHVSELSEESVKGLYQTGKAYVHDSLDIYGRPVLVVVAAKHFPSEQDPVENEKLCAYLIEKALSRLPLGTENILGIFDLRGFGVENGDLQFLKFLIDVFYYYYPKRLGQVLFVDAPFIFQPLWQVVKPLLKSYASLVRFCDVETVRKDYFTEETVPPDFRS